MLKSVEKSILISKNYYIYYMKILYGLRCHNLWIWYPRKKNTMWNRDIDNCFPKKRKYWCIDFTDYNQPLCSGMSQGADVGAYFNILCVCCVVRAGFLIFKESNFFQDLKHFILFWSNLRCDEKSIKFRMRILFNKKFSDFWCAKV